MTNFTTKSEPTNLQIKLSFDEGLQKMWSILLKEYEGLDKASIIRLAINHLAKHAEYKFALKKYEYDDSDPDLKELTINNANLISADEINNDVVPYKKSALKPFTYK
jgi:hypothetical protein